MIFRRLIFFWWRFPIPKTIIANAGASNWRCLGGVGTGSSEVRGNKQTAIDVKISKYILCCWRISTSVQIFLNLMSFRGLLHQLTSLLQEGDKRTLLTRLNLKANYFVVTLSLVQISPLTAGVLDFFWIVYGRNCVLFKVFNKVWRKYKRLSDRTFPRLRLDWANNLRKWRQLFRDIFIASLHLCKIRLSWKNSKLYKMLTNPQLDPTMPLLKCLTT